MIEEYEGRGITITEVASGFRMQVTASMAERLQKLWEERPAAVLAGIVRDPGALIAYRQPITRGEIEEVRGVSVSPNIVRSRCMERDWVRVVGHRDVPGRPEMFGTTKTFLDYFGLKKLDDLPPLADLSDWESLRVQLNLPGGRGGRQRSSPKTRPRCRCCIRRSMRRLPAEGEQELNGPRYGSHGADVVNLPFWMMRRTLSIPRCSRISRRS